MKSRSVISSVLVCVLLLAAPFVGSAQTGTSAIDIKPRLFLTGLSLPVLIRSAQDGTGRLFVVQQRGRILVVDPGSSTPTLFMDLTTKVSQTGSERGLLGLAFHPQFASNGYFFVNYTRISDNATVVARYRANSGGATGNVSSERILLTIAQPFANHNGGMIEFGPDGALYIGMGDGGSANDPLANAQNINSLLGKMLRITPDVSGNDTNPPYTVPADNPFVGIEGADEIFAVGLRNPWRWSFDRGGKKRLWAGDVGQNAIEEVDVIVRGGNYGWRVYEGTVCTGIDASLCVPSNYSEPVFQYNRTSPRCAITGGYVYRGKSKTFPDGAYIYADYCTGEVMMWFRGVQTVVLDTPRMISSFGEDDEGELYIVGLGSSLSPTGTVEKLARSDRRRIGPARTINTPVRSLPDGTASEVPAALGRVALSADIDGDGNVDTGMFDSSRAIWRWYSSSLRAVTEMHFGQPGDIPSALDHDSDGIADLVVYRPSESRWYVLRSSDRGVTSHSISPVSTP